jgi:hypothetical protein
VGKFRDECLSMEWFRNRVDAKIVIEQFRRQYNPSPPSNLRDHAHTFPECHATPDLPCRILGLGVVQNITDAQSMFNVNRSCVPLTKSPLTWSTPTTPA